jgi:hypothetical protein
MWHQGICTNTADNNLCSRYSTIGQIPHSKAAAGGNRNLLRSTHSKSSGGGNRSLIQQHPIRRLQSSGKKTHSFQEENYHGITYMGDPNP